MSFRLGMSCGMSDLYSTLPLNLWIKTMISKLTTHNKYSGHLRKKKSTKKKVCWQYLISFFNFTYSLSVHWNLWVNVLWICDVWKTYKTIPLAKTNVTLDITWSVHPVSPGTRLPHHFEIYKMTNWFEEVMSKQAWGRFVSFLVNFCSWTLEKTPLKFSIVAFYRANKQMTVKQRALRNAALA